MFFTILPAQKKINLAVLLVFPLFFLLGVFLTKSLLAQEPDPYVDCSQVSNDEFHSLRPYQASACKTAPTQTTRFCGNRLVLTDNVSVVQTADPRRATNCSRVGNLSYSCTYSTTGGAQYQIDLSQAELPILGNTQDTLDDAEKTNEYVSWYLNGVIGRAEEPFLNPNDYPEDVSKIVDFSGPLNKLLPWEIQAQSRIKTIENALASTAGSADIRHDQVVACTRLGVPVPCTDSFIGTFDNKLRLSDWVGHMPPLASDPQYQGQPFDDYWRDYMEWRGRSCTPNFTIPIINKSLYLCFENPLRPNYWSNLFSYIPFSSLSDGVDSSTEDRVGLVRVNTQSVSPASEDLNITNASLTTTPAELFFSHTEEVTGLADLLQLTFAPQEAPTEGAPGRVSPSEACDLTNIRTNEGDSLFAETITGNLSYNADFSCEFEVEPGIWQAQECVKDVSVGLNVVTETPKADSIWSRLVAGPSAVFKRIFPKVGEGGAILGILDIPAATRVNYSGSGLVSAGNPGVRSGQSAELYFPHIGGVSEYFLKGIQTILRPKGYGEQIISGQPSEAVSCGGDIPQLPSVDSSCTGGACSGFEFPSETMGDIFKSAASFYKVPLSVLIGVFYNEGGFERYDWNEELVRASSGPNCEIPNCRSFNVSSTGAIGPWQFIGWGDQATSAVTSAVNDGRTPNPCNLLDSTFAAAAKLARQKGGWGGYSSPTCVGVTLNTGSSSSGNSCSWSDSDIVTAARQYLGYCDSQNPAEQDDRFGATPWCMANASACYQRSILTIARSCF